VDRGNPDPPVPVEEILEFVKNKLANLDSLRQEKTESVQQEQCTNEVTNELDDSSKAHPRKGKTDEIGSGRHIICLLVSDTSIVFDQMNEKLDAATNNTQLHLARELCQRVRILLEQLQLLHSFYLGQNYTGTPTRSFCRRKYAGEEILRYFVPEGNLPVSIELYLLPYSCSTSCRR
jgi:hypothetical protein